MMFLRLVALFGSLLAIQAVHADEFVGLKCDQDIAKALKGRIASGEKIIALEARHKDLNLQFLGGDGVHSDPYALSFWSICGQEYVELLTHKANSAVIGDVLAFPKHNRVHPQSLGPCSINGKDEVNVIALLNREVDVAVLPAEKIWRVDDKQAKFVELAPEGVSCGADTVITADGGR